VILLLKLYPVVAAVSFIILAITLNRDPE